MRLIPSNGDPIAVTFKDGKIIIEEKCMETESEALSTPITL
ncbi:MAG TPA: hypothetical protein VIK96_01200 [Bacilli bacterium]